MSQGNTPDEKTFVDSKADFIEENYPNIEQGKHTRPDVFIAKQEEHGHPEPGQETSQDKGNINENIVYQFLNEQFKDDDCFIFHSYKSGIDNKVVAKFCNRLHEKLHSSESSAEEVKDKMIRIANLALLDWENIETETKLKTSQI